LGIADPIIDRRKPAEPEAPNAFRRALQGDAGTIGLDELPETSDEVRRVGHVFAAKRSDMLLREAATESAFRSKSLAQYDVIHFATHGLIAEDIPGLTESALLLTVGDEHDGHDDGLLSASEVSRLSLNARLVILSACNTARYSIKQVTFGMNDFQAAFAVSGASTLLASLWPVESSTARELVVTFSELWRSGQFGGAAASLARASRDYLQKADRAHQHPRFWASFAILGDGGVLGRAGDPGLAVAPGFLPIQATGGEISSAVVAHGSLFLSMMSDWDGTRMASVIGRRRNGSTLWEVRSREVGAAAIAVGDDGLYALGYTTEDHPTPVVRSFSLDGELNWQVGYPDLRDHAFAGIAFAGEGLVTVAYPRRLPAWGEQAFSRPWLLMIDRAGKIARKVALSVTWNGSGAVNPSFVAKSDDGFLVATNSGANMRINEFERNILGIRPVCFQGATVSLVHVDRNLSTPVTFKAIGNFYVRSLLTWDGDVYLGGETLDNCSAFWQGDNLSAARKPRPRALLASG
jgi:hypothetical protein